uniref:Uncharacterized protein n=1 Tax=Arundo donax TaxID=35708 RepID=A0A0A8YYA5_ARUDO
MGRYFITVLRVIELLLYVNNHETFRICPQLHLNVACTLLSPSLVKGILGRKLKMTT